MAVAENAGAKVEQAQNLDKTMVSSEANGAEDQEIAKPRTDGVTQKAQDSNGKVSDGEEALATFSVTSSNDGAEENQKPNGFIGNGGAEEKQEPNGFISNGGAEESQKPNGFISSGGAEENQKPNGLISNGGAEENQKPNGFIGNGVKGSNQMVPSSGGANGDESLKRDMRNLQELLSKLNPMAEEFVPHSIVSNNHGSYIGNEFEFGYANGFVMQTSYDYEKNNGIGNGLGNGRKKKNSYGRGRRRMNSRTSRAQQEEVIRRTVYVSDIDQQVTEEQLAALFNSCGQVVDCRICGDPNSVLRFAFVEFTDEEGARAALSVAGTMLGYYPVKVLPSKTAIAPVNPTFLPRDEDEREMCSRTIYCTNIDRKVLQTDLKIFFESTCGEVYRLRLLGDYRHPTRIAFVEFVMAESAILALNCSGAVLGSLPIRVSPSKTPVRPRAPLPSEY